MNNTGNVKASPLLAPICYEREVPAVIVQRKINYVLFAGRLNVAKMCSVANSTINTLVPWRT